MPHTHAMGDGLFELRLKLPKELPGCFTAPLLAEES
jgi:hypothetical protein